MHQLSISKYQYKLMISNFFLRYGQNYHVFWWHEIALTCLGLKHNTSLMGFLQLGFKTNVFIKLIRKSICQEAKFWIISIDLIQHLPQAVYFIKMRWAPYLNFCQYASVKKYLECSLWKLDIPSYTSTTLPSSHRDQMTIGDQASHAW